MASYGFLWLVMPHSQVINANLEEDLRTGALALAGAVGSIHGRSRLSLRVSQISLAELSTSSLEAITAEGARFSSARTEPLPLLSVPASARHGAEPLLTAADAPTTREAPCRADACAPTAREAPPAAQAPQAPREGSILGGGGLASSGLASGGLASGGLANGGGLGRERAPSNDASSLDALSLAEGPATCAAFLASLHWWRFQPHSLLWWGALVQLAGAFFFCVACVAGMPGIAALAPALLSPSCELDEPSQCAVDEYTFVFAPSLLGSMGFAFGTISLISPDLPCSPLGSVGFAFGALPPRALESPSLEESSSEDSYSEEFYSEESSSEESSSEDSSPEDSSSKDSSSEESYSEESSSEESSSEDSYSEDSYSEESCSEDSYSKDPSFEHFYSELSAPAGLPHSLMLLPSSDSRLLRSPLPPHLVHSLIRLPTRGRRLHGHAVGPSRRATRAPRLRRRRMQSARLRAVHHRLGLLLLPRGGARRRAVRLGVRCRRVGRALRVCPRQRLLHRRRAPLLPRGHQRRLSVLADERCSKEARGGSWSRPTT